MDWFGSLGACGNFQILFLFGGREGGGRFEYKPSLKVSTAKGGNKEKRNTPTTLLAPLLLLPPVIYLYS